MKKILIALITLVINYTSVAQFNMSSQTEFYISTGETVTATGAESIYSNEFLWNDGVITMGTGTLELGGDYSNYGISNLSNATIKLSGSENQSLLFNSSDSVKKIILNKSAGTATAANGSLAITDYLLSNQGTLNAAGKITLKSNATKTAVVENSLGGAVNNIVVERYIPARRAFRLVSSPVTTSTSIRANWQENGSTAPNFGTHISGTGGATNGFDTTGTNNTSLFTFTNNTPAWVAVSNTNGTLTAGDAYRLMVRGDRTIDLTNNAPNPTNTTLRTTGNLYIGSKTITNLNQNANGYSLIGNPYQSPVNMKTVLDNATNLNTSYYYIWDPKMATRGAYVTGILSNGTNNVSGSQVNQYLQPGQACFIKTNTAGAASLHFEENYKYTSATNEGVFKLNSTIQDKLQLTLYNSASMALQEPALDGLIVLFDSNETNDVNENDAGKFTNLDETFSTLNGSKLISIESRATATPSDVIPLKITQYRGTNYTIVADGTNMNGLPAYLHDLHLQSYTEISQNGIINYDFTIDSNIPGSIDPNRFEIVFSNPNLNTDSQNHISFSLYPNPSNGKFNIRVSEDLIDSKLEIFNTLGQEVNDGVILNSGLNTINLENQLSTGVYFIKVSKEGKESTQKIVIE